MQDVRIARDAPGDALGVAGPREGQVYTETYTETETYLLPRNIPNFPAFSFPLRQRQRHLQREGQVSSLAFSKNSGKIPIFPHLPEP